MTIAAIDIGSNSVHMIAAEIRPTGGLELLDRDKRVVRLGDDVFKTGVLQEQRMEAAVEAVEGFVRLAQSLGASPLLAVATSAVREASNGELLMRRLRRRAGVDARVITGEEEARLIHLAVRNSIELSGERVLVIDIGGGSVELTVGRGEEIHVAESLPLGVARLRDQIAGPGKLSKSERQAIRDHVDHVACSTIERIHEVGFDVVVGTSGTIRALGEIAKDASAGWATVNSETVETERIGSLAKKLAEASERQRVKSHDVDEWRADTIHVGALVLVRLLENLGAEAIVISDGSLREGVIYDYVERSEDVEAPRRSGSLRQRAVVELAKKYGSDALRARHIRTLALELFDATASIHGLAEDARRFLEYAADLHRVGLFVGYRRHHKHARYLVRHAGMPGFTNDDVRLLSLIVRYQRKALPARRHKRFRRLSKSDRALVRVLAGILRVAIALDRRGSKAVRSAVVDVRDDEIVVYASGVDVDYELAKARGEKALLEAALDRSVAIVSGIHHTRPTI